MTRSGACAFWSWRRHKVLAAPLAFALIAVGLLPVLPVRSAALASTASASGLAFGGRKATPPRCETVPAVGPAVAAGSLLSGVAATSSCDAWAVGGDPVGSRTEPLIEHWNGRFWRQVPSPQPGAGQSAGGTLAAVAAGSFGDAWAVGWSATAALAEHWDGSSWKLSPVLGVANYRGSRCSPWLPRRTEGSGPSVLTRLELVIGAAG